jgi:hypothetical protein
MLSKLYNPQYSWKLSFDSTSDWIRLDVYDTVLADYTNIISTDMTVTDTANWHYVVARANSGSLNLFLDGSKSTANGSFQGNVRHDSQPLYIGASQWSSRGDEFHGSIDEVRISATNRSDDWIAAQHKSMDDTFATYGPEDDHIITGDIYLAIYRNKADPTKKLQTYLYDESARSWSAKTDVLSPVDEPLRDIKVSIDENTGDVYVVYQKGGNTAGKVYYQKSTDGMTSWGPANEVISTTAKLTEVRPNLMSGQRIYVPWYIEIGGSFEIRGDTILDNRVTETWGEDGSRDDYTGVTEDTFIDGDSSTIEEGTCTGSWAVRTGHRTDAGDRTNRALIKFNLSELQNLISDSSQIVSAYLNVRVANNIGSTTFDAYRLLKDWYEGDECHPATDADDGETTWQWQSKPTEWSTAGADGAGSDRESSSGGTFSVNSTGWKSWDLTQSVKDMFTSGNYYGWVLKSQAESGDNYFAFNSSEEPNPNEDRRPYLEITYDPGVSPSLTLADHSPSGQVGDKFTNTTPVTDVLYRFKLTRTGTVNITDSPREAALQAVMLPAASCGRMSIMTAWWMIRATPRSRTTWMVQWGSSPSQPTFSPEPQVPTIWCAPRCQTSRMGRPRPSRSVPPTSMR